ncbi:TOTE conflict system archaeo-eukaryotic primase domain-containing protein [Sulfitobacter sp. JL08]|uniref:TOTE conflict system archaeo-eukaryotic primase domain-containing protein n=1 Tax=Sulfitobacter sp. JL08 TaxID=2070369 RepID=UPI0013B3954D|nr:PriCT-2 domain-containing protein [Sulfitobacter sp. JL08]
MEIINQIVALGDKRRHTQWYINKGKTAYRPIDAEIDDSSIKRHVSAKQPLGMLLHVDEKRTKSHCLVFDFDDHDKKGIALGPTLTVARHLQEIGIPFLVFRSGGGHGYHIWVFWEEARRVDTLLSVAKEWLGGIDEEKTKYVVVKSGKLNQTKTNSKGKKIGVEHGIEILPKGTGEQNVAIPCSRASVPMRLVKEGSVVSLEECRLDDLELKFAPLQKSGRKASGASPQVDRDAAFDAFIQAYDADGYSQWGSAGICLQAAFGKEDAWAQEKWEEWSRSSSKYEGGDECEWDQLTSAKKYSPLSFWRTAKNHGYDGKWPHTAAEKRKLLAIDFLTDVKILRDQSDKAYAELRDRDFVPIDSSEFKETIALALYRKDQNLPDERAVKGAQMIAMAMARDTDPENIALRYSRIGGKRYAFLADKERSIVEIDVDGWRFNNDAPVQFRKGVGLPMTVEEGGTIRDLTDFLNVDDDSMVFLLAWMVTAIIHPGGQCPIAVLDGIAGSGKSSTLSTIVQIVDPKVGAQAGDPSSEEDLLVSAYQSAVMSFDNVTSLAKLSDPLCRLSTGGGMSKRKMYTNEGVFALDAMRPVMVAGVDPTFYKQDLIERIIRVTLTKPTSYMDEEEFMAKRQELLPRLRGALYDLAAKVLRDVHGIEQKTARFGVYSRVGESIARQMGRSNGWFLKAYADMRMSIAMESSEADSVFQFLTHYLLDFDKGVGSRRVEYAGALLMEMKDKLKEAPVPFAMSDIPSQPRVMGSRIAQTVSLLRKSTGWSVTRGHDREFIFEKVEDVEASAEDVFAMAEKYARQSVGPRERVVVAADRFRGVSYPDVVEHLLGILRQPQFLGKTSLCIDGTAMGRVVSDILQDQGIEHHAIQMTGGQEWSRKGRYANVSKTLMIETLSVQFASGELTFARDLTLRKEIEEDLASFTLKTTAAGNQVITQSRTSAGHGDLGIALAIAAFASQHFVQGYIGQSTLRGYW